VGWSPASPNCYDPTRHTASPGPVIGGDVQLDALQPVSRRVLSLALVSLVIVCAGAIARIVRSSHDQRTTGAPAWLRTALRAVAGIAAIELGFAVLSWLIPLFSALAADVFLTFVGLAVPDPSASTRSGRCSSPACCACRSSVWSRSCSIPVLLFQLIRFVLLMVIPLHRHSASGIAAAPLFFALAVFDHQAQVVQWWWRLMLGALVAPVVALGMLGLTIGLALRTAVEGQSALELLLRPLVSVILVIGGSGSPQGDASAALRARWPSTAPSWATVRHAAEALLFVPAAVASVAAGGALLAAGAGGGGALLRGLSSGRFGSGVVGSAMATDKRAVARGGAPVLQHPDPGVLGIQGKPGWGSIHRRGDLGTDAARGAGGGALGGGGAAPRDGFGHAPAAPVRPRSVHKRGPSRGAPGRLGRLRSRRHERVATAIEPFDRARPRAAAGESGTERPARPGGARVSRIRVPLAVDANLGVDVGPFRLPIRAVALMGCACSR